MLTGNKGEWSEIYVFLRLLADGALFAADAKLVKIPELFYPILSVLREEDGKKRTYHTNGEISVVDGETGATLFKVPTSKFLFESQKLLKHIKEASGRSFGFSDIEKFINSIDCKTLKPSKSDKADIKIVVHDLRTGQTPELSFSIKSMLGKASTLFNASGGTNFIYKIKGPNIEKLDIDNINSDSKKSEIFNILKYAQEQGFSIEYSDIQSEKFKLNLQLIDSRLPEIFAHLLLSKYTDNPTGDLNGLVDNLKDKNPLGFDTAFNHPFYEYKIKNFLTDAALGMTSDKIWTGKYDATGGIIIVKDDGDIVCYHIYNRNEFQEYLLKNTRLEQASRSRYEFGKLYKKGSDLFINLNLQIRFK